MGVLLYDGDCGFCRRWIERWRRRTGDRVQYLPFQTGARRFPSLDKTALSEAVHWVGSDETTAAGAEAVFRALAEAPRGGAALRLYRRSPLFAAASEAAYRLVARRRRLFSALDRLLWGPEPAPARHALGAWLFLRLLGLVYLSAFVSLWCQLDGLLGERGILPAAEFLRNAAERLGPERFRLLPTLAWLSPSDGFLHLLCGTGTLLSLLLLAGAAPLPALAGLWACYLSLVTAGGIFMGYQWDNLLLETGLLALLVAPLRLRPERPGAEAPAEASLWLLRILAFKLMFLSGAVKLLSGDPAWRSLSALQFHYETQPLPPWTAWYAHQLPAGFQKLSCGLMFGLELAVPFLFLAPRRPRAWGAAATAGFMGLIMLTGNYCFFNLLAVALCAACLDDAWLRPLVPARLAARLGAPSEAPCRPWAGALRGAALAAYAALCAASVLAAFRGWQAVPAPLRAASAWLAPLRSVNGYGLFAVMTPTRPEIEVEGSLDGKEWRPYLFKYKPGPLDRAPRFNLPHQPRLDWQMWFASLGSFQQNPWFLAFQARLLEGSEPVLGLLASNPFPEGPPRFIRSTVSYYRFTDWETGWSQGLWWQKEPLGPYGPVVSLRGAAP